jgi:diguanylate cyclase (GGDEF)-like protein
LLTETYQQALTQLQDTELEIILTEVMRFFKSVNNYQMAFEALEKLYLLNQQLFDTNKLNSLAQLEEKYQLKLRDEQIAHLARENELKQTKINNQALKTTTFILGTVLLIILAITLVIFLRRSANKINSLTKKTTNLEKLSIKDPLTGLNNRRALNERMQAETVDKDNIYALLLLDIDHFKHINDSFGHACGDYILVELAQRIKTITRSQDMVARWGGEEFVIYMNHINQNALEQYIERLLTTINKQAFTYQGEKIPVTISIGYYLAPEEMPVEKRPNWQEAMKFADLVLYQSKRNGRNQATGMGKKARRYLVNSGATSFYQVKEALELGKIQPKIIQPMN